MGRQQDSGFKGASGREGVTEGHRDGRDPIGFSSRRLVTSDWGKWGGIEDLKKSQEEINKKLLKIDKTEEYSM